MNKKNKEKDVVEVTKDETIEEAKPSSVVEPVKEEAPEEEEEKRFVTWKFKYRNYREILPWLIKDEAGRFTDRKAKVLARNYKVSLDLEKAEDKEMHEYLLQSGTRRDGFCNMISDRKKADTITKRALTLEKLMRMNLTELNNMLTDAEKEDAGLLINCTNPAQLIMAIVDSKTIIQED